MRGAPAVIDPHRVEMRFESPDDEPTLEIIERFRVPEGHSLTQAAEFYRVFSGANVEADDEACEIVVRATGESAVHIAAAVSSTLVLRAGGGDEMREALASLDDGDELRGFD